MTHPGGCRIPYRAMAPRAVDRYLLPRQGLVRPGRRLQLRRNPYPKGLAVPGRIGPATKGLNDEGGAVLGALRLHVRGCGVCGRRLTICPRASAMAVLHSHRWRSSWSLARVVGDVLPPSMSQCHLQLLETVGEGRGAVSQVVVVGQVDCRQAIRIGIPPIVSRRFGRNTRHTHLGLAAQPVGAVDPHVLGHDEALLLELQVLL